MRRSALPLGMRSMRSSANSGLSSYPTTQFAFNAIQRRELSTPAAATTPAATTPAVATSGNAEGSSSSKSEEEKKKKKNVDDGLPWGLIFGLGLVGSVGAWFYRGWKNNKKRDIVKAAKTAEMALAGEEVEDVRFENALSAKNLITLYERAQAAYPQGRVDPDEFMQFACEQLGGKFVLRGHFGAPHLVERLLLTLPRGEEDGLVPLEVMLMVTSLGVSSPPSEIVETFFEIFADSLDVDDHAGEDRRISQQRLEKVLDALMQTCQLPSRCYVKEIKEYPLNEYELSNAEELGDRAITSMIANRKREKTLKGYEETAKEEGTTWNKHDFNDLLMSNAVCVWGECHSQKRKK